MIEPWSCAFPRVHDAQHRTGAARIDPGVRRSACYHLPSPHSLWHTHGHPSEARRSCHRDLPGQRIQLHHHVVPGLFLVSGVPHPLARGAWPSASPTAADGRCTSARAPRAPRHLQHPRHRHRHQSGAHMRPLPVPPPGRSAVVCPSRRPTSAVVRRSRRCVRAPRGLPGGGPLGTAAGPRRTAAGLPFRLVRAPGRPVVRHASHPTRTRCHSPLLPQLAPAARDGGPIHQNLFTGMFPLGGGYVQKHRTHRPCSVDGWLEIYGLLTADSCGRQHDAYQRGVWWPRLFRLQVHC